MRPQDLVGQKMGATDTAQIWSIDSIILPFIINVLEAPPLHQSSLPKRKARAQLAKIRFLKIGKASKNTLGNQICSSGCQLQGSRFWFSSTPLHFEDSPDYVDLSSQPVYTGLFLIFSQDCYRNQYILVTFQAFYSADVNVWGLGTNQSSP